MYLHTIITTLIIFVLLCIIASLGMGLYYLVKDRGKTKRTVKALSVRIILSFLLFFALILAFIFRVISPHSLFGTEQSTANVQGSKPTNTEQVP